MKKIITVVIAVILAILFAYAAYNKLKIYHTFVDQLAASPITKQAPVFFSWAVLGIEIIITALLLIPRTRLTGLFSAFFLMLIFSLYVYVLPHFFKTHTCSCGGI